MKLLALVPLALAAASGGCGDDDTTAYDTHGCPSDVAACERHCAEDLPSSVHAFGQCDGTDATGYGCGCYDCSVCLGVCSDGHCAAP